jgi:diphosphomevalonate decarboxylase
MPNPSTAISHPNIAFIKYWGNRDEKLRLPANGSISMNLGELSTTTSVHFGADDKKDLLFINGHEASFQATRRVSQFVNLIRQIAGIKTFAHVETKNDFPSGAGIASSSSAFAALALAASSAAGLTLDELSLSKLARRGSGSASRSVPGGFVEWRAADQDEESYSFSIASEDHWDLVDCIAIVSEQTKSVGSTEGHELAPTSPLQAARVQDAQRRLDLCRAAILNRDFEAFTQIVELDCHLMHAVMMTSQPALHYWLPASLAVMQVVRGWRASGLPVCYTLDAGPNVHVLCPADQAEKVASQLIGIQGVIRVLRSKPGGATHLIS